MGQKTGDGTEDRRQGIRDERQKTGDGEWGTLDRVRQEFLMVFFLLDKK